MAARRPYLVKISLQPAIVSTNASKIEIVRLGNLRLPKCEPTRPPMIAAAARYIPSNGIE